MKRIVIIALTITISLWLCSFPARALPEGAVARLGKGSIGQGDRAVAFSPADEILAVATSIGIYLYDSFTLAEIAFFETNVYMTSVAFSPDGRLLAGGSGDNTVKLWDVWSRKWMDTLQGHLGWVTSVAFSPDGRLLASGSFDNTVKLWDVEIRSEVATLEGHSYSVTSVAFSPDGALLASGSYSEVKLWDTRGLKEVATLTGHSDWVYSVAFSPGNGLLASGSFDNTIKLWDARNREEIATLTGHLDYVSSVSFSPAGRLLASGSLDDTVKLWDVEGLKEIATLQGHSGYVKSVAFSPDGGLLASGSFDNTVRLWNVESYKETAMLKGYLSYVSSISFSPGGKLLASGSWDSTVKLWDVAGHREVTTLKGHSGDVSSVAFSHDGNLLASGSSDAMVKLWDVAGLKEIATLQGHSGYVNSVAFSPDGELLASGSWEEVKLWDVAGHQEVATLTGHPGDVHSVSFNPYGDLLASGSYSEVKLWDVASHQEVATLEGHSSDVHSVAFNPDGDLLASGSLGEVKLWDVAGRKELVTLEHLNDVWSVAFSPDGSLLASGSYQEVKLWNVASRQEIATFRGHSDWVYSVAFSPDNRLLASGSMDGTVLLWDMTPFTQVTAPMVDFSASPTSGPSPLTVSFTDLSTNDPTSWWWDFGDGEGSDLQNPTHIYTKPGYYTVSLTVATLDDILDKRTKADYIYVLENQAPSITLSSKYGPWESGILLIEAQASDVDGRIQEVLFLYSLDGETWRVIGTDTISPYIVGWNTTSVVPTVDSSVWVKAIATDNGDLTAEDVIDTSFGVDNEPPTTSDDYDGEWHRAGFIITLTGDDKAGSGIASINYRINDGQERSVSDYGHPGIDTEGANNKLEYWGVDSVGNEEKHHILSNIKLDKTKPAFSDWVRNPADLTQLHQGVFRVQVKVTDAGGSRISGDPSFDYRIGADTKYDGYEAMASDGDSVWYFDVTANWNEYAGQVLYYKVQASDVAGNISTSIEDSELIDPKGPPVVNVTSKYGSWESGVLTVGAKASDVDGRVQEVLFLYSLDGETWRIIGTGTISPYIVGWNTTPVIPTVDGSVWVKAIATDDDGLTREHVIDASFGVDNEPPTTGDDYDGEWHRADFTITLTGDDKAGSGIASINYRINDGQEKSVSKDGYPRIDTEGSNNKLEYWGVDSVGNEEKHHTLPNIKLDKTPPVTEDDHDDWWHKEDFIITLTGDDIGSGIAGISYRINDGQEKSVSKDGYPRIDTEGGNNKLEYWGMDSAGNEEKHHILSNIKLDKTNPAFSDWTHEPADLTQFHRGVFRVQVKATDAGGSSISGDPLFDYHIGAGTRYDGYEATASDGDGVWHFDVTADWNEYAGQVLYYKAQVSDAAGNIFTSTERTELIEKKPPPVVDITSKYRPWESGVLTVEAEATDLDGSVQEVLFQYSLDGETWHNIGIDVTSPYSVDWDTTSVIPTMDGSVWVLAFATDDDGLTGEDVIDKEFGVDNEPPITTDDYDGGWHNADFVINLIGDDKSGSGIASINYRINDGEEKSVSADGHPGIGTEENSYKLEYWSTDNAGNEEEHHILSDIKPPDITPPVGSVTINGDAEYTDTRTVALTLLANDHDSEMGDGAQMRFSSDNVTFTEAEPYATIREWQLPEGDGEKAIYVKFADAVGNWTSEEISDTIVLDTTPPEILTTSPANGEEVFANTTISATYNDALSGIDENSVALKLDNVDITSAATIGANRITYSPPAAFPGNVHNVNLILSDKLGNETRLLWTFTVVPPPDTKPPIGSVTINNNMQYTNNRVVALELSASDDRGAVSQMRFSNDNITFSSPETYNDTKAWNLTSGDGTKTVYVRFKDAAGNWSTVTIDDSIIMDTTSPEVVSASPTSDTENIAINAPIKIDFSEEIDESSIAVSVSGDVSGDISGKISYIATKLTFVPDRNFSDKEDITIEITARDLAANRVVYSVGFSTGISVWPGDTNRDGIVDILDIPPIGRYWHQKGDPRTLANTSWEAQPAVPWEKEEATHADADGNGVVDDEDVKVIDQNWGQERQSRRAREPEGRLSGFPAFRSSPGVEQLKAYLSMLMASAEAKQVPAHSSLGQNYPNPFNPETWIPYQLAEGSDVTVEIYNVAGQLISTLSLGYKDAGTYIIKQRAAYWDGRNDFGEPVSSGVYFYRIKAGDFTDTKKLIVVF